MSHQTKHLIDFDDEARKLFTRLNLDSLSSSGSSGGLYSNTDPIYRHPTAGGTIYVGNKNAAENLSYLKSLGIARVVNCTHGYSKIPDYHQDVLKYLTFPISHWQEFVDPTNASVGAFLCPLFQFIDKGISRGESVLVHCLAGAHRAGTTGVLCLMHYAGLEVTPAIRMAKQLRPIIDPIGQLPDLLNRYSKARLAAAALVAEKKAASLDAASASNSNSNSNI